MANEYKKVTADKKREAKALMTDKQLKEVNIAIHTAAVAAGAGGIVPIPVMDSIPISAAQVTMVIALGKIFGQKVTESAAKGVIGAAASTLVGRSLAKLIPIAGWIASAAVAAGVTEAIGWTIAVDFAKMGSSKNTVDDGAEQKEIKENSESSETDSDVLKSTVNEKMKNTDTVSSGDLADGNEEIVNDEQSLQDTNEEKIDDESVANDFSKAFGEEEE